MNTLIILFDITYFLYLYLIHNFDNIYIQPITIDSINLHQIH